MGHTDHPDLTARESEVYWDGVRHGRQEVTRALAMLLESPAAQMWTETRMHMGIRSDRIREVIRKYSK